ncbi:MAG: putative DNA binding domain-containing protein [Anaerolineae bacterium]|nr:putative DNA binding domain-containing protein [Anaerolineae bacterium]
MVSEKQVLNDMCRDERQKVEFKEGFIKTGELAERIMAFANADGGIIYLGIAEGPPPHPSGKIWQVTKDHYDNIHNGRILIRRGSENVALLGDALRQALLERGQPSFDDRPVWEASLDDLDPTRVEWYLKRAAQERNIPVDLSLPLEQNLVRLGAVIRDEQRTVPRVAGLLLFGKEPQRFVPQSVVRLARFQGKQPLNFIDRLDCTGTLPEMIDEAERFVKRNTRVAAKITGFERREITEYPYPAIREAIANAVAHRDYWRKDVEVRVSIFADRIEVQSPGRLPAPLTLDTLGEDYALRNRLIAQLLFNIRYIEAWNTGIRRMRRWMKQHGLQEPVFQEIGRSFRATFYGPGEDILDLIPEEGITDLRELGLNERQIEALRLMVNEERMFTNREYCRQFGVSAPTATRDLGKLVEVGQAVRLGQGRNTRYVAT